jgi:hypothetical protein
MTGGQSVTLNGMSYTAANLNALIELRSQLKTETDRTTRPTIRAFNFGGAAYGDTSGTDGKVQLTSAVSP